eukprot:798-Pelagococcus_subviridis.AAC.2
MAREANSPRPLASVLPRKNGAPSGIANDGEPRASSSDAARSVDRATAHEKKSRRARAMETHAPRRAAAIVRSRSRARRASALEVTRTTAIKSGGECERFGSLPVVVVGTRRQRAGRLQRGRAMNERARVT